MKSRFLLIVLLLLFFNIIKAQSPTDSEISKFNANIELGFGTFSLASANFEVHFANSDSGKINWYGKAGFGFAEEFMGESGLGGLGAVTMLTGKRKHHFEASGGIFIGSGSYGDLLVLPLLDLGYRYQKPGGGFIFRGKIGVFSLGVGIGIGYAF